jgi:hypothetical protein
MEISVVKKERKNCIILNEKELPPKSAAYKRF